MNAESNPQHSKEIQREIVSGLIFSQDGKLLFGKKIQIKVVGMLIVGIFQVVGLMRVLNPSDDLVELKWQTFYT